MRLGRVAGLSLLAGAAAIGLPAYGHATPVSQTITDNYYGGLDYYPQGSNPPIPQSGDVIGDTSAEYPTSVFDITSAVVTLDQTANTLTVVLNTYFAGMPGTAAADGTTYGSLFLAPASDWNPSGTAANHYYTDTYQPGQWTYAVNMGSATSTTSTGSTGGSSVYAIGAPSGPNDGAVDYPSSTVAQDYTTTNGEVTMSNVGGNPISYPIPGAPGYWFREGQAVSYTPSDPSATAATGMWTVVNTDSSTDPATEGSITYVIDNYSSLDLGSDIAISWAMTCANDVIQGTADFLLGPPNGSGAAPLPPSLPLFAAGLGLLGIATLRRRTRAMSSLRAA
jgi:hypothetical protein